MSSCKTEYRGVYQRLNTTAGAPIYFIKIKRKGALYAEKSFNIYYIAAMWNDCADMLNIKGARNMHNGKLLSFNSKDEQIQQLIKTKMLPNVKVKPLKRSYRRTAKYRGVSERIHKSTESTTYQITAPYEGKYVHLGTTPNPYAAAAVYNDFLTSHKIDKELNLFKGKVLSMNSKDEEIQQLVNKDMKGEFVPLRFRTRFEND